MGQAAELLALRAIGWDHWDPIGIRQSNDEDWRGSAADEYDSYLAVALAMTTRGASEEDVADILDRIGSIDMGLGLAADASRRASRRTASALASYVATATPGRPR